MPTWSSSQYLTYNQLSDLLAQLATTHPDIMRLDSIGTSHGGRDIWLVTLTRFDTGKAGDRPALWIDANIHSVELVSSVAALHFIEWLIENRDDDEVSRCLQTRTLYICPRVNPDGAEWALADTPRFVRSGIRPYPQQEALVDGIEVCDLNNDGRIVSMRVPDPHGPWKISEADPRLMVRRSPTETGGQYFRLLPEGMVRNYDGFHIPGASQAENLDFNRNFPVEWRDQQTQHGAGDYPASEPEVRALVNFISTHPNICAGLALHSYSGVLLRPYSFKDDDNMPAEDLWLYQAIGKQGEELTGYPALSAFHEFRYHPQQTITGAMDDWLYEQRGLLAWTVELWSPHREAGITMSHYIDWFREHPEEDDLKLLQWNDEQCQGKAFIDWQPFLHPQLGEVEIGGWDTLFSLWNPPVHKLAAEVARLPRWMLWHALITPSLEWLHCTAEKLDNGLYQVQAAVVNSGWLDTQVTRHALNRKLLAGVTFELTLPPGTSLLQGLSRVDLGQLKGRSDTPSSPSHWLGEKGDATDDRAQVKWLLRADAGCELQLEVSHPRAGRLQKRITLE